MKRILAATVIALVALIGLSAPSSAAPKADNTNTTSYWEAHLAAQGIDATCTKTEYRDGMGSLTLPVLTTGSYVLLVLKAGSGDGENEVWHDPMAGVAYEHSTGKDISHAIVCVTDGYVPPPS